MCGILGLAGKDLDKDHEWFSLALQSMNHRGPDDSGEFWIKNNHVGLGHTRLSILDLSLEGHQPMHHSKYGVTIVFNGEIYNHNDLRKELIGLGYTFKSKTDTEVLLIAYVAWGIDCLSRIIGMFSFAIYNFSKDYIFLARDRAGEKPLFYRLSEGKLQFSSELKALLENPRNPRKINLESLDCYLTMGFIPGSRCILEGYHKLPPAHAMIYSLKSNELKVWRYWEIPDFINENISLDRNELLDELDHLLENSVKMQLIADVPVGILLSGGVDSSIITALAARISSEIRTYTIGFPGFGNLDETKHARLIANFFGTKHTELMAEEVTLDLFPILAKQFDEPMVDSSMIPTFLVSKLVRKNCKVALGGDGGDELFGGYNHYSRMYSIQKYFKYIPQIIRNSFSKNAESFMPIGFKGRNWLQALGLDFSNSLPIIPLCFDPVTRTSLVKEKFHLPIIAEKIFMNRIPFDKDIVQRHTRMDFSNYLPEDILVKVDRSSMLASLEMRSPFLDYRIIEFAYKKVPSKLKATASEKKILLKHLAKKLLPPDFDFQRKQGFSIPLKDWLTQNTFKNFFKEVFFDSECIFNPLFINKILKSQSNGNNNSERLFSLVLFELWRREYKAEI